MFGYIYLTTNLLNGRVYVGKKEKSEYVSTYYGSGKVILQAIKKYGKENFTNKIIDTADTLEELNEKEKSCVSMYKEKYGELCYNLAEGGTGGNALYYMSDEQRQNFVDKMTVINSKRAKSPEHRKNIGQKIHEYYINNPDAKKRQSIKIKEYYTPEQRRKHGELIKARSNEVKQKCVESHFKPCVFKMNDVELHFVSVKDLMEYLITEQQYHPDRRMFNKLLEQGAKGIPYKPFHSRQKHLEGMVIYRVKEKEDVSTNRDECNDVG